MFFTDMCCGRVNVLYRHVLFSFPFQVDDVLIEYSHDIFLRNSLT